MFHEQPTPTPETRTPEQPRKNVTETSQADQENAIKNLERLVQEDATTTATRIAEIKQKIGIETDSSPSNISNTDNSDAIKPDNTENPPTHTEDETPEEHELEYKLAMDNINLMKQGLTSSVFENGREINTLNLGSVLEAELQAKPLNYDLYQGEAYNVDLFLDDTIRLPELAMIVEIAHEEMSVKLEFAKEQKKREGDENAEIWYQQKMKELWNTYKEADDKIDELIIAIEDAHDPEGAEKRKNKRIARDNESQQLQQALEAEMEEQRQIHEAKIDKQKQMHEIEMEKKIRAYKAKMEEQRQIHETEMKKLADRKKEILAEAFDQEIIDAERVSDIKLAVTHLDAKDYTNEVFANDIDKLTQYTKKQVITNGDISDIPPILEQINQKLTTWAAIEVQKNET